ncbi:MAG TPA: hypothetical protein VFB62_17690 [Polyangiaceae bacterium]|nr:hypothetical protein [Polyangiaceae bacterium]
MAEERSHHEIREDIERTREDLTQKASELTERAAQTARKFKLSYQVEHRPFAMLAISVAAGFVAQRLLFRRRPEPNILVVSEDGLEQAPRRVKRRVKDLREEEPVDEDGEVRASFWHSEPMRALTAAGQIAAGSLAREVATRLISRKSDENETIHH